MLSGENGTGKELVARALHAASPRRAMPFVPVNCSAIPEELFESELFGHEKGAFTGATQARRGRFEEAHAGTLMLDEVADLSARAQTKLLRVLQESELTRVGGSRSIRVDVRVISATNRDLAEAVARGEFREDLLYRLNLIALHLPALRERPSDVPLLAAAFLERFGEAYSRKHLALTPAALAWLARRDWPGNVRQLRQTLERAVLVVEGERIDVAELDGLRELESRHDAADDDLPAAGRMTLDELERAMIAKCLDRYRGNLTRVSEALGLSRAALYRRLRKYGLDPARDS